MKLFQKKQQSFYDLPKEKRQELLLKAAKKANKEQKSLESRYLKLQSQHK